MRKSPAIVLLAFLFVVLPSLAPAQEQTSWVVKALNQVIPGAPSGNRFYRVRVESAR